jgi:hypothetical protein
MFIISYLIRYEVRENHQPKVKNKYLNGDGNAVRLGTNQSHHYH